MKEIKSIKTALENIQLTASEKRQGAEAFYKFMAQNPLSLSESPSFYQRFFHLSRRFIFTSASIVGVLLLSTGGVSYAAESAVPGDVLYSVKTQFNEPVQGFFHFSAKAKLEWEIERMERRLKEAEILERRGQIKEDFREDLNRRLDENQAQILEQVKNLRERGQNKRADEIINNVELIMEENEDSIMEIEFTVNEDELSPLVEPELQPSNTIIDPL